MCEWCDVLEPSLVMVRDGLNAAVLDAGAVVGAGVVVVVVVVMVVGPAVVIPAQTSQGSNSVNGSVVKQYTSPVLSGSRQKLDSSPASGNLHVVRGCVCVVGE